VKNRFQSLPFKCNLQRYNVVKSAQPWSHAGEIRHTLLHECRVLLVHGLDVRSAEPTEAVPEHREPPRCSAAGCI
jgi:hypothetical protein